MASVPFTPPTAGAPAGPMTVPQFQQSLISQAAAADAAKYWVKGKKFTDLMGQTATQSLYPNTKFGPTASFFAKY